MIVCNTFKPIYLIYSISLHHLRYLATAAINYDMNIWYSRCLWTRWPCPAIRTVLPSSFCRRSKTTEAWPHTTGKATEMKEGDTKRQ